jgi:hypothetical protein
MGKLWTGNREAEIQELIEDPVALLVMRRDGIAPEQLWATMRDARQRLITAKDVARSYARP